MPGVYEAAEKGVIDMAVNLWGSLVSYRQYEVFKYWTNVRTFLPTFCFAMNLEKWNKLPKDIQKKIMSVGGVFGAEMFGREAWDKGKPFAFKKMAKEGYKMKEVKFSPKDLALWKQKAGKPTQDKWVAEMKAKGCQDRKSLMP